MYSLHWLHGPWVYLSCALTQKTYFFCLILMSYLVSSVMSFCSQIIHNRLNVKGFAKRGNLNSYLNFRYPYGPVAVTGLSVQDDLDLEVEAEEAAGFIPGVRVVPAEHLATTDIQVGEFFWPY